MAPEHGRQKGTEVGGNRESSLESIPGVSNPNPTNYSSGTSLPLGSSGRRFDNDKDGEQLPSSRAAQLWYPLMGGQGYESGKRIITSTIRGLLFRVIVTFLSIFRYQELHIRHRFAI